MIPSMKIITLFLLSLNTSNAFTLGHHGRITSFQKTQSRTAPLQASSVSSSGEESEPKSTMDIEEVPKDMLMSDEWREQLNSEEILEVRKELVLKYTSLGSSPEVAEKEVDEFLSDKERCEQYLDMRRYAQAQADELTEFKSVGQLVLAFVVGFVGTVGPKLYDAYQVSFKVIEFHFPSPNIFLFQIQVNMPLMIASLCSLFCLFFSIPIKRAYKVYSIVIF